MRGEKGFVRDLGLVGQGTLEGASCGQYHVELLHRYGLYVRCGLELDWEEDADGEQSAEEELVLGGGAQDGV